MGPLENPPLADVLFSKVQQRLLALLFGNPQRSFYSNELIELAESGKGAVQRELERLSAVGLLTVSRRGNQKHYQVNTGAPIYSELRGLVLKTFGLADVLRAALAPLAGAIEAAFVYGSIARQEDTASSDVDLMVISPTLTHGELFAALEEASVALGRTINPTVYSPEELRIRIRENNSFVIRVLDQPKIWILGGADELAA
jgi:predicted nucleotidyltransferase